MAQRATRILSMPSVQNAVVRTVTAAATVAVVMGLGAACDTGTTSGGGGGNTNYDPLRSVLDDPPYLEGSDGLDVSQGVADGRTPYSCTFVQGDGAGTVPSGVSQDPDDPTGCTLQGDVTTDDATGSYGFLMEVSDDAGDTVVVPVFYAGSPCSTANVTFTDPAAPPPIRDAGSGYDWTLEITDIDFPCDDASCDTCQFCLDMHFNVLEPLSGSPGLVCAEEGDVCSDCGQGCLPASPFACPSTGTMTRVLEVRPHDPIRQGPAWVTMELEVLYTGDDLAGCSGKRWLCHIETLEL